MSTQIPALEQFGPTNADRAERIPAVITAYRSEHPQVACEPLDEFFVASLLTDLQHYCHQHKIDFETATELAETHFRDELGEEARTY